jgi:hypothetical protein
MTPYAMKKAKGKKATKVKLKLKPLIKSGIRGPIMLVKKEITKNVSRIRKTI